MGITRRALLFSGVAVGGGLLLGVTGIGAHLATHNRLEHQRQSRAGTAGQSLNLWLRITEDNRVVLLVPHTEMGQGSQTGLGQIVAEELDIDWEQLHIELAPAEYAFANGAVFEPLVLEQFTPPAWAQTLFSNGLHRVADLMGMQVTGGSTAVRGTGWLSMRKAAAAGRAMLLEAAARRLGEPLASLQTASGHVLSPAGERLSYGSLVAEAAALEPPAAVHFKDPADYRLIGQSVPRIDVEAKVKAQAVYGIDADVPGMKYAAVAPLGVFGAELARIENRAEVQARAGVQGVYAVSKGVAVVADNPWRAEQAVRQVSFSRQPHDNDKLDTEALEAAQRQVLAGDLKTNFERGDVALAMADAGQQITAEYVVPYLAHATMEPMNATVWEQGGKMHVQCGVQNPLMARQKAAQVAGLDFEDVVLHPCTMGGGFGRRVGIGMDYDPLDWLQQAVEIHRASGEAVKMTWSREMDMRTDVYRPLVLGQFHAGLEDDGKPRFWASRTFLRDNDAAAPRPLYDIPHQSVQFGGGAQQVPVGFWRSVEHSQHGFFVESFIDELAHAAGSDPLAYRLALLDPDGSYARVLRRVAEMAGWRPGVDEQGRAMGVALVHSFGTTVAQVAEVSREGTGSPRVHRVWAAVDCGVAVNPQSIRAQVAGGIHFGLSAALYGQCDIKDGAVVQSNYHDYRLVKMADAPAVEVELELAQSAVGGVGEVGVPPIAPAVANALAVLGERQRRLPLRG